MKSTKILSLSLSILMVLFAFAGCSDEKPKKEGEKGKSSSAASTTASEPLDIPLDISLLRSDSFGFAQLMAANNAGKTEGTYYINFRESYSEIAQKLENGEANVGVMPISDALRLCTDNPMMKIVGANVAPDLYIATKDAPVSLADLKDMSILAISANSDRKRLLGSSELAENSDLQFTTDTVDALTLAASGLYDAVIADYCTALKFSETHEDLETVSDISALLGENSAFCSFALVSHYETYLGNTAGFDDLKAELSASAAALSADNFINLGLCDEAYAELIADNLKYDIKFFGESETLLSPYLSELSEEGADISSLFMKY